MPDPGLMLEAVAGAAIAAGAILLLGAWPWRAPPPTRTSVASVLAVAAGFYVGCWRLGLRPRWPVAEDQDRLLLVLFPAVVAVEFAAACLARFSWLAWPLRWVVAAGGARVLLHATSYLTELAGPGSREWTAAQTWLILAGLGVALAVVWTSLALLARRAPGRSIPLALAVTSAGAAITVMLSGYASGGQIGLPLAAALAGATVASLALPKPPDVEGVLGLGVVGLFALVVVGRFFGQLSATHAALLFFAPLLCWLPELPPLRRPGPALRGLMRVALTAIPVAIALALAQQKFAADSTPTSSDSNEPSIQDYSNFST